MQVDNKKPVTIIMSERSFFDRAGKLNRLFKSTIGYFHLLIANAFFVDCVAPATSHTQIALVQIDLQLVGANTGDVELNHPAVGCPVNIGGRVPQTTGRPDTMRDG